MLIRRTPTIRLLVDAGTVDKRLDDAVGELGDQRGERGTDDHRGSQVDDVAPREKLLEPFEHADVLPGTGQSLLPDRRLSAARHSVQGQGHRLTQRRARHRVRHASRQRHQHYAVAVRGLDLLPWPTRAPRRRRWPPPWGPIGASPGSRLPVRPARRRRRRRGPGRSGRCRPAAAARCGRRVPPVDSASRLPSKPDVGEHLSAPRRAGQRRADHGAHIGFVTRREQLRPNVFRDEYRLESTLRRAAGRASATTTSA